MTTRGGSLVGRELEVEAIASLLSEARKGRSRTLVLGGEPGIGKSALLELAVELADEFRVLRARGVESESGIAFAGLQELFGPVLDRLGDLPERQRAVLEGALALGPPVVGDPLAVCAATLGLLAAAAEDGPLLLAVDDAHWLDPSSAGALAFAARRLDSEGIVALFAVREDEPTSFNSGELRHLTIGSLAERAARQLLADRPNLALAPAVADQIIELAAGNPLALLELPTALSDAQRDGNEPLEHPVPVGKGIQRAFGRRLERLPDHTRAALIVMAASERSESGTLTAALKARGLSEALEPATRTGLISDGSGGVWFTHALVRSVVYESATSKERREAHAALAAASDPTSNRVWHQAAATARPAESIAAELEKTAGAAAGRGAPLTAARAFERAAQLSPDREASAARYLAAATAAWTGGKLKPAATLAEQSIALTNDPVTHGKAQLLRAAGRGFSGSVRPAMELLVSEAAATERLAPALAAHMLMTASTFAEMDAQLKYALELAERAHELVQNERDETELLAATARWRAAARVGGGQELVATLGRLSAQLSAFDQPLRLGSLGEALRWLERLEDAAELLRSAASQQRRAGALAALPYLLGELSEVELALGDIDRASANAAEGAQLARESQQDTVLSFCLACCARVEATRGLEDDCLGHVAEALELADSAGAAATRLYAGAARGLLEVSLGRAEDAVATLEPVARQAAITGLDEPNVIPWQPDLIEAYARAGRTEDAKRELRVLERRAESTGGRWSQAVAARCAGLLAAEDEFDHHFERAAALHRERPMPFEEARTDLCWAERQRRAGRRTEARLKLRRALAVFAELKADPWADRTERELRATGITARPRNLSPEGRLTPQQLRVALVIADGATVREAAAELFLSPKTVEAHLGRAYRKLGVRNRAQLAKALDRHQPGELP